MSTKPEPIDKNALGWAVLGLLSMFAWLVTMVGQFIGVAWFYPWLFFALFVILVMKTSKEKRKTETSPAAPSEVASPNEIRSMAGYKLPHLASIPGQYTRKPCTNPEWIQIPLYRNYEINCSSLDVRYATTKELVAPGYDPDGIREGAYLELLSDHDIFGYVRHDWLVETALGKDHK